MSFLSGLLNPTKKQHEEDDTKPSFPSNPYVEGNVSSSIGDSAQDGKDTDEHGRALDLEAAAEHTTSGASSTMSERRVNKSSRQASTTSSSLNQHSSSSPPLERDQRTSGSSERHKPENSARLVPAPSSEAPPAATEGTSSIAPPLPLFIPAQPIKQEPEIPAVDMVLYDRAVLDNVEDDASRAEIDRLANEHNTRATRTKASDADTAEHSPPAETSPSNKKRAMPKSTAANKKGTAKKPTARKPRASDNMAKTGGRRQSNSSKTKSTTPVLNSDPAEEEDLSMIHDEDGESDDDKVYCICRKGDNHEWMVACEGPCEDWYHGSCVKLDPNDGDLLDVYFCVECEAAGHGKTLWKAKCRRPDCRSPARIRADGSVESKYCSQNCGVIFMQQKLLAGTKQFNAIHNPAGKKKFTDDEVPDPRGGVLHMTHLKALVGASPTINEFHALGEDTNSSLPTPPGTAAESTLSFTNEEKFRLANIAEKKDELRAKRTCVKNREKILSMAKARVSEYAEREGIKPRDVCGYDRRLAWTDTQISHFLKSAEGAAALAAGKFELPAVLANGVTQNGDVHMGEDEQVQDDFFCRKKRCERHRNMLRLQLEDCRMDETSLANEMRRLDQMEADIKLTATIRLKNSDPAGDKYHKVEVHGKQT